MPLPRGIALHLSKGALLRGPRMMQSNEVAAPDKYIIHVDRVLPWSASHYLIDTGWCTLLRHEGVGVPVLIALIEQLLAEEHPSRSTNFRIAGALAFFRNTIVACSFLSHCLSSKDCLPYLNTETKEGLVSSSLVMIVEKIRGTGQGHLEIGRSHLKA